MWPRDLGAEEKLGGQEGGSLTSQLHTLCRVGITKRLLSWRFGWNRGAARWQPGCLSSLLYLNVFCALCPRRAEDGCGDHPAAALGCTRVDMPPPWPLACLAAVSRVVSLHFLWTRDAYSMWPRLIVPVFPAAFRGQGSAESWFPKPPVGAGVGGVERAHTWAPA